MFYVYCYYLLDGVRFLEYLEYTRAPLLGKKRIKIFQYFVIGKMFYTEYVVLLITMLIK